MRCTVHPDPHVPTTEECQGGRAPSPHTNITCVRVHDGNSVTPRIPEHTSKLRGVRIYWHTRSEMLDPALHRRSLRHDSCVRRTGPCLLHIIPLPAAYAGTLRVRVASCRAHAGLVSEGSRRPAGAPPPGGVARPRGHPLRRGRRALSPPRRAAVFRRDGLLAAFDARSVGPL